MLAKEGWLTGFTRTCEIAIEPLCPIKMPPGLHDGGIDCCMHCCLAASLPVLGLFVSGRSTVEREQALPDPAQA